MKEMKTFLLQTILSMDNKIAVTFPVKCSPGQSQDRTLDDEPLTRIALYNFPNR